MAPKFYSVCNQFRALMISVEPIQSIKMLVIKKTSLREGLAMKRDRIIIAVLLASLLCTFLNGASAAEIRERFEKTYDFRPGGEVVLDNTNGSVTVETWSKNAVRLEALKKVKARSRRDAEAFMERVKIRVERSRNRIRIETEYPKRHGDFGFMSWMFGKRKPEITVEYTLKVPEEVDLDLRTVNGAISVRDVEGQIELHTTNGRIDVEDVLGSVKASTVNGSIEVELENFGRDDEIRLKTVNGAIVAYFPEDMDADVEAGTVNGSIRTDFPLQVRGKWGPKRLSGSVGKGGALVKLGTVNGSIKILER